MIRHFYSLFDLGSAELAHVLDRADRFKSARGTPDHPQPLSGKTVVILLEKTSTRTRVSFEVGIRELGGHPLVLLAKDTQLGRGEPLEDTARMLGGYAHAVVYRTFAHDRLRRLSDAAQIPVINGLTDDFHPCQLVADLQTVREHFGQLKGLRVAWIGDGNNMAHSWVNAAKLAEFELVLSCPEGFEPNLQVLRSVGNDMPVRIVRDPLEAARGAHVVTTDVWASMGQEAEASARQEAFLGFCVDGEVMSRAEKNAIFLHCLPAH
ncbi:MAG: ornithine carbamoyltransferase, partial [Myxococcota bacterium]